MREATPQTIPLTQMIMKELRRIALPGILIFATPAAINTTNGIGYYAVDAAISRMERVEGPLATYNAAKDYSARVTRRGLLYNSFGGFGNGIAAKHYMLRILHEGNGEEAEQFAKENPAGELDNYFLQFSF